MLNGTHGSNSVSLPRRFTVSLFKHLICIIVMCHVFIPSKQFEQLPGQKGKESVHLIRVQDKVRENINIKNVHHAQLQELL